jgi:hypothetical protein
MELEEPRKKGKIKYKYARSEAGIVFINDLENTSEVRKKIFTCISCGNLLIPKLGKIKQKHFAHKHVCDCSLETYLHRLAKEKFFEEYNNCLKDNMPFYVEVPLELYCDAHQEKFGLTCQLNSKKQKFDITKKYKDIRLEAEFGGFIPDISLFTLDEKEKIFIEIFVTHKSTDKKIGSGFKIIEIHITQEEDIEAFQNRILSEQDGIKFYGFNIKPVKTKCPGERQCPNKLRVFKVFKNGKSICTTQGLPGVANLLSSPPNSVIYHEIIEDNHYWSGDDYIAKVIDVYAKGIPIKNCYLCKYQGDNKRWNDEGKPIFCCCFKFVCNSSQAAECEAFRV